MNDEELDMEVKYEMLENPPEDPLGDPICPNSTEDPVYPNPIEDAVYPNPTEDAVYQPVDEITHEGDDRSAINTNEMINIALNVLQACKEESDSGKEASGTPLEKLQYFTKQPVEYLNEAIKNEIKYNRSMKQALKDLKTLPVLVKEFISNDVRNVFVDFYVKRKEIPTVTGFMTHLNAKRENGLYKDVTIRTLVKHNLVDYHYFPTLNRYLLTENPKSAYHRHLYLRQITAYRSQEKSIVYVVVLKILPDKHLALAVSSTAGVIGKTTSEFDYDNHNGCNDIKVWIRSELLPVLSPSSVVVLIQPHKIVKTLLPSSKKKDIVDWLKQRDIPCDVNGDKAELYQLYKIYLKKYKELGFFGDIFASAGVKVLVCIYYPNVVFLYNIWSNTSRTGNALMNIVKALRGIKPGEWMLMERKLINEENLMMKHDEEMGTIVDNLMQMAKNGDLEAEDFPEGCVGTKEENFEIHVGDFLIV